MPWRIDSQSEEKGMMIIRWQGDVFPFCIERLTLKMLSSILN